MDRVISTDPRKWTVLAPCESRRPLKRFTTQIWIKQSYIGISDDVYVYLRRPRYLKLLIQDNELALMPCGADEEGARIVHEPKNPRKFYHLLIFRMPPNVRHGDYNNVRLRMVGGEPYAVFDASR